ncbi:hypothetical protein SH139x_003879 [Planctomycetaceae bacterium SH139]
MIPSKKPTAEKDDGLDVKDSRGGKTPLELFVTTLSDLQTSDPVAFAGLKALIGQNRKQLK